MRTGEIDASLSLKNHPLVEKMFIIHSTFTECYKKSGIKNKKNFAQFAK